MCMVDDLMNYKSSTSATQTFIEYFNKNWYSCKYMWVYAYRTTLKIGSNNTNNRVESINKLLKQFIKYRSKMSKCLQGMFNFLNHLSEEMTLKQWNEKY